MKFSPSSVPTLGLALGLAAAPLVSEAARDNTSAAMPDLNNRAYRGMLKGAIAGLSDTQRTSSAVFAGEGAGMTVSDAGVTTTENHQGARKILGVLRGQLNALERVLRDEKRKRPGPLLWKDATSFAPFYVGGRPLVSMGDSKVDRYKSRNGSGEHCETYELAWPPYMTANVPETALQIACTLEAPDAKAWMSYFHFPEGTGERIHLGSPDDLLDQLGQNSTGKDYQLIMAGYTVALPHEQWPQDLTGFTRVADRKKMGLAVPEHSTSFGVGITGDSVVSNVTVHASARFFDLRDCDLVLQAPGDKRWTLPYDYQGQGYLTDDNLLYHDVVSARVEPVGFRCRGVEEGATQFVAGSEEVQPVQDAAEALLKYMPKGRTKGEGETVETKGFGTYLGGATIRE